MFPATRAVEILAFCVLRGLFHESWIVGVSTGVGLAGIYYFLGRSALLPTLMSALWGLLCGQVLWDALPYLVGFQTSSHIGVCVAMGLGVFLLLTLLRTSPTSFWSSGNQFEVRDLEYEDPSTNPIDRVRTLEKIRVLKGYEPGWLYYQCKKRNLLDALQELREETARSSPVLFHGNLREGQNGNKKTARVLDPYEILGVPSHASVDEIRAAYRKMIALYHPDKVAHLGSELQRVAHERTLLLRKAFEKLADTDPSANPL